MTEADNTIQKRFEQLIAQHDEKGARLTQKTMADRLNAEGFPSLSGQPWSKYSIRRVLKNLSLQGTASSSPTRRSHRKPVAKPAPAMPERPATEEEEKEVVEHKLKDTSPLMQWNYYESIRDVIVKLTSKPYSEEKLAARLNKMAVPTADGNPWFASTVSRVVKVLSPSNTVQTSEDVIRDRIKLGWYDTETERFIAVAVKQDPPASRQTPKPKDRKEADNKGKEKEKKPKKGAQNKKKGKKQGKKKK